MKQDTKDQVYQDALDAYKEAVVNEPTLSFAGFCRKNRINQKGMEHWLNRNNMRISEEREKCLKEHGFISTLPIRKCPGAVYEETWYNYIEAIKKQNITMALYCLQHEISCRGMQKWMERHNLTVAEARQKAGLEPDTEKGLKRGDMSDALARRMTKAMDMYKRQLRGNTKYSVKSFCKDNRIHYRCFVDWLKQIGVTEKQLKAAAILEDCVPKKRDKVFIQFTPNGGSNSDRLRGVKIQMADGNNILVQECTVISLCAFINQYNNDLKRGKKTCLN